MSIFTIPLDRSIEALNNFVKTTGMTNKKRLNKSYKFIVLLLIAIAIFLGVVFWEFGHFILNH
jgi:hypothetical protein